ncbi:MAG: hypothetical protein SR1Q7_08495 [Quinella sp. 1Q7]|nr:hypothetical protein [Quinella sp. 1Q7]
MTKILNSVRLSDDTQQLLNFGDVKEYGKPDKNFTAQLKNFLLNCDNERANLDAYDENILFDPNRGHWDLWDFDVNGGKEIPLGENFVARNPVDDVSTGIVAIDFGTSRTVVVYENEHSQIIPLQVGSGSYRNGINLSANYENPTVIQFIDIESFLTAYYWRDGRPFTRWADVKVSHEAFENMTSGGSEKFYSFLTDLKYWCGSKAQFMLRDEKKFITQLAPFAQLAEDEINPLEIYAYYLGLFINNMQQEHHIFLNYILSFPVTYEREIREKMRRCFERGLRKSLPTALLSNAAVMKKFSVREGASEAAAYAITALQEYGFDPEDDEEFYYAVFDFGGGTTDFDFGFLRESSSDRYDYLLVHFGENGDRTLGGENLLKLMAFELFKANQDRLLNVDEALGTSDTSAPPNETPRFDSRVPVKIPFTWAADKINFAGSEALIKDSQEAHSNMHALMEKLRPVWEAPDSDAAEAILSSDAIEVNLFSDDGQLVHNFPLELNIDLQEILRERIKIGIKNFFISMKEAFDKNSKNSLRKIKSLREIDEVAIFLAGNSSKSPLVTELFEEYLSPGEDTSLGADDEPFVNGRLRNGYELKSDYYTRNGGVYRRDDNGLEVWMGDMDSERDHEALRDAVKKIPADRIGEKSQADILFGFSDNAPEFKLYPALGTEAAHEIQAERGVEVRTDLSAPTGKTGVAFGLLLSRAGGLIKTKHITPDPEKTPFACYVGRNKKRKFKTIIDRNTKFDVWYPFIDAGDSFDIFYTNLPEAVSNQMSIQKAKRITVNIDTPDENATVFIRAVKSNVIEYRIALNEEELSDGAGAAEQIELA